MLILLFVAPFVVYYFGFDNSSDPGKAKKCRCLPLSAANDTNTDTAILIAPLPKQALLASRINTLSALKSVIQIEYLNLPSSNAPVDAYSRVQLKHCSDGIEVSSVLESGISQSDIFEVFSHNVIGKTIFLFQSPFAVANRVDLFKVFNLARRKPYTFGEGDVAFYDLAKSSVNKINTPVLAYKHPNDSTELGYINTFNHITAQAFMTSCFSEEIADFISDVHERDNMAELTTGRFTAQQLSEFYKNPVDNYVDMINNEWGQELGKKLKTKYNISQETYWTPELLANYLNDLQAYYSQAFQIGFKPYFIKDPLVIRFASKINLVMQGTGPS